ncbi:YkgB family protein [Chryseobacterium oranimense]|uniref:YkgB family protein n=1 Tax=Chryseobacterium oranimense TaxID=421058 RepID=UPI0021AFA775|nr:YkgB family protein [Chryseobacterium oranimense]UWX62515.1 YkgB family protein [Chryseobacterium oranimense]
MNGTSTINVESATYKSGYYISLFGAALILLWIGIFKFTPTEASAIKPLVENHFLTFFVYKIAGIQTVSNAIGTIEIIIALLLIFSVKFASLKKYAAIGMIVIFLVTLSYLFTTPGVWKVVDGVPVTDFFILKDVMLLGFGLMILQNNTK